ncbi:MAG TPA: hypothetical protein VNI57_15240, partial [Candidatus Saccharimonadales bacterium]|nr:hypothetical protein [Candidatus Saccharimonadales bacterium]
IAATEEALSEALAAGGVGVVILSLDSPSPDPFRILSIVRERGGARTVGFLSHVLEDLRDRAIAAGCDRVLAKGAFARGLPEILVEMASQPMERNP